MANILVVDDDRNILDTFVDLFSEHGYTVETCRDGKQAIEHLRSGAFDLLLLDVLIPHINGFALVEQMNEDEALKEIPSLFSAASTAASTIARTWFIMSKWLNTLTNPCKPTGS